MTCGKRRHVPSLIRSTRDFSSSSCMGESTAISNCRGLYARPHVGMVARAEATEGQVGRLLTGRPNGRPPTQSGVEFLAPTTPVSRAYIPKPTAIGLSLKSTSSRQRTIAHFRSD